MKLGALIIFGNGFKNMCLRMCKMHIARVMHDQVICTPHEMHPFPANVGEKEGDGNIKILAYIQTITLLDIV